jgi:hypothetical protein
MTKGSTRVNIRLSSELHHGPARRLEQSRKGENGVHKGVVQHHCSRCLRDSVDDPSTDERYAVYVSVFSIDELPELITTRWLGEFCPGEPLVQALQFEGDPHRCRQPTRPKRG